LSSEFFVEVDRLIAEFIWNCKGPRIGPKMKKKVGLTFSSFKIYSKTVVIKIKGWGG